VNQSFPQRSWDKEVHSLLTDIIRKQAGLACFDFDNTLIRNDLGEKLMASVINEGMIHIPSDLSHLFRDKEYWKDHTSKPISEKSTLLWEEYTYQLKEFGIEMGYRWTSFLFQGLNREDFYSLSRKTWEKVSKERTESSVFPQREMLDLIDFLKSNDWDVFIVTASPELGIAAISSHFGVEEDHVIGMRQEQSSTGKNLPILVEPYTYGEGKVKAIQTRIGRLPDLAFGDSFNDFPMLCSAKQMGVAIDRGNPEFVSACLEKGIKIQPYFSLSTQV
jgi:HAD superfamily phosphoserine phosphatase-like hydrolase